MLTEQQKDQIKKVLRETKDLSDFKVMILGRIDFLERTVDLLYDRIMIDRSEPSKQ